MFYSLSAPGVDAVDVTVCCLYYRRIGVLADGGVFESYPMVPVFAVVALHQRERCAQSFTVLNAVRYGFLVAYHHVHAVVERYSIQPAVVIW